MTSTGVKQKLHGIVPQQHIRGRGWVSCPAHKADAHAAYWQGTLLGRAQTAVRAAQLFDAQAKRRMPDLAACRLGTRPPKATRPILATSRPKAVR